MANYDGRKVDLYLYTIQDQDIISWCNSINPAVMRTLVLGLIERSAREGTIDLGSLMVASGEKGGMTPLRLNINRTHHAFLYDLWQRYPRGARSAMFVSLLRTGYKRIKANGVVEESLLREEIASDSLKSYEVDYLAVPEKPRVQPDELPIEDISMETGGEMTNGRSALVDDLLSSLDD